MKTWLLVVVILTAVAPAALADAVLRAVDPVEMKISGVPADEQTQVNNVYTVDANGMVNMPYINKVRAEGLTPAQPRRRDREWLQVGGDFHQSYDHDHDAAADPFREHRRRGARSRSQSPSPKI